MINQLFTFSSTIERLRQGPLSAHLDAYAAAVADQGYTDHSIRQQIVVIADFSRWLKQKHIDVPDLDSKFVDRFLRLRRRQQRIRRGDPKALERLLTMLRKIGVVKHQPPVAETAHSRIVGEFQRYLLQERGLSPLTLLNYVPVVEQFLAERFHNRAPDVARLRATHVTGFVTRHAHQLSPARAGVDGNGASVVFSVSATPRSNRYRARWLRPRGSQLVAFHASKVSAGCHSGTYSEVLRSKDARW
jgi:hypothetical protein